ncbi:MAG: crossover junction endodeoxyribonuclease RuvC, crossover junction endodeoxyribonuclease RuvC [Candidatus Peregrinibacteria bacterium GW2011_GWF2_43_17]|nr:MAG: crossover junction endodeoxyribonuclease RuvC, crossover junction endodeoxyribonuclease RuvC [Candidatus Peregrinibacteria bacterium GW2011_GWF2_43_17]KKT20309.1 MAG: Crossover junction endodeoxyribonuclease RuvC [Candidatus Peregrinibacteria bacterium GW2011_GWA2_43_8]HAU39434.1 crossover junction endodeoxyribonuclease RuvC [Candidatus Peregrinibacteria bacterium]
MTDCILGIDPGTATTGYAIIKYDGDNLDLIDFGIIKTSPADKNADRLKQICDDIETLIKKFKPNQSAIEEIFFTKNVKTGIKVAQARGAIIATLTKHNVEVSEYKPVEIKSAITGNGQADKKQVQKMVQIIMKMKMEPMQDDAADAIAIAITHAWRKKELL